MAFCKIGLFAFGGAYSFLPLIEREVVENYHWITREEFIDMLGVVKIFPGAISIKYATFVGYKVAGVPGAIVANLANLIPPLLLILFASTVFMKYKDLPRVKGAFNVIQLVVFAMIIAVGIKLIDPGELLKIRNVIVVLISFGLFMWTKVHPALIIITAGIVGAFYFK